MIALKNVASKVSEDVKLVITHCLPKVSPEVLAQIPAWELTSSFRPGSWRDSIRPWVQRSSLKTLPLRAS